MTAPPEDTIRFVDLATQRARIADRIDAAIARVLDHGQYIMGPEVAALETALSDHSGAAQVATCASGTDALLIALMAFGVGPGDAILCPDFTYTATPESIALLGATPVFVGVSEDSFNLDPRDLDNGLARARAEGLRPRGLIAVDLFGLPADYAAIVPWATAHDLFVLADAAQSYGASTGGARVGTFGTVTATSFFPAKPLGSYGDGGALFTDDDALAETFASVRSHGKATGGDKYDIARIGLNSRLDTMQAAILLEKLAILDEELAARRRIASRYTEDLDPRYLPPAAPTGTRPAWAQYTIRCRDRDTLRAALSDKGIPTNVYYPYPLHRQTAYGHFPRTALADSTASRLSAGVLSLPVHPYLTDPQLDHVVATLNDLSGRHGAATGA
jgi:dTDP-4-amino-4,6-dideoxygalactose transaminase